MKFEINDIENDEEIQDFLRAKPRRESTKKEHLKRLRKYCDFLGKKPVELIREAEEDEENRIRMKKRRIRKYFLDYSEHLRDEGRSQHTIHNHFSSIKSFYRNAELELPNVSINSTSEIKRARNESIPFKEDIEKALKHCKFKYKAIILLMSSSGMGSGEIRNLKFEDFLDAINEFLDHEEMDVTKIAEMLNNKENIIATWNVQRQKQGNNYYTFSSPESIKAIIDYLIERQKKTGTIPKEEPLFENFGKKISEDSFSKNFQRINDAAEFGMAGRQRYFKSHSLRKYFASTLHKNGLSQIDIDWLLGHEINGVDRSYIKADPSNLKEQYLKVVEDLSIAKVKVQMVTTEGYDSLLNQLQEEIRKREQIKEELNEKDGEMEQIKEQMEQMGKTIKSLDRYLLYLERDGVDAGERSLEEILEEDERNRKLEEEQKRNNENED